MSSKTLQYNAGRIKPVDQPPNGKPLDYFVNLPENIETTELTQLQLREFISLLLTISSGCRNDGFLKWPFDLRKRVSQPRWVSEKWQILMLDPIGVIKWAVQFLTDDSEGVWHE